MEGQCGFVGGLGLGHFGVTARRPRVSSRSGGFRPRTTTRMTANGKDIMADLKAAVESIKENRKENRSGPGSVYLVGTGPGDPSLLTLGAVQLMKSCDVVLYDRLVSNDIMNFVNPSARMIYVGKEKGFHTRKQEDIHDLLFQFAEAGGTILRLKVSVILGRPILPTPLC
mmetsp:Transcript_15485/g.63168  ORF Transcript_15485/g.63168 Transcript_15485/m.63168 type:complete len:170 (-) Transcript_15485:1880-2389(-)